MPLPYASPAMEHLKYSITLRVSVPVLSLNTVVTYAMHERLWFLPAFNQRQPSITLAFSCCYAQLMPHLIPFRLSLFLKAACAEQRFGSIESSWSRNIPPAPPWRLQYNITCSHSHSI
jgi:hypothetical protein